VKTRAARRPSWASGGVEGKKDEGGENERGFKRPGGIFHREALQGVRCERQRLGYRGAPTEFCEGGVKVPRRISCQPVGEGLYS